MASTDSAAYTPKNPVVTWCGLGERHSKRQAEKQQQTFGKVNAQHSQLMHHDRKALLCSLGVKPSLSVLKIQTNPATLNLNLLWWKKNQNKF